MRKFFLTAVLTVSAFLTACGNTVSSASEKTEIDMTDMSFGMLSAQIHDMTENPDNYENQKIKAGGLFSYNRRDDTDVFTVLTADETGCCSLSVEFILGDGREYPEDYPAIGDRISVTGDYETYQNDGHTCFRLVNAEIHSW